MKIDTNSHDDDDEDDDDEDAALCDLFTITS